jgi:LysM repeat protein
MFVSDSTKMAPAQSRPRRVERRRSRNRRLSLLLKLAVLTALLGAVMTQVVLGTAGSAAPAVVVQPGQSLWSIAVQHYPQSDPRAAIAAIESANHLQGAAIMPGERLLLPPA